MVRGAMGGIWRLPKRRIVSWARATHDSMKRPGSASGSGRRITVFTTLNIAALAPRQRAMASDPVQLWSTTTAPRGAPVSAQARPCWRPADGTSRFSWTQASRMPPNSTATQARARSTNPKLACISDQHPMPAGYGPR